VYIRSRLYTCQAIRRKKNAGRAARRLRLLVANLAERATGLEPATSSLGSMSYSHAWRSFPLRRGENDPGATHMRSRAGAYKDLRVPRECPRSHHFHSAEFGGAEGAGRSGTGSYIRGVTVGSSLNPRPMTGFNRSLLNSET
jgi:hypothetical protein